MGEELFNFFLRVLDFPASLLLSLANSIGWQTERALLNFYALADGNMRYIVGAALYLIFQPVIFVFVRLGGQNKSEG